MTLLRIIFTITTLLIIVGLIGKGLYEDYKLENSESYKKWTATFWTTYFTHISCSKCCSKNKNY